MFLKNIYVLVLLLLSPTARAQDAMHHPFPEPHPPIMRALMERVQLHDKKYPMPESCARAVGDLPQKNHVFQDRHRSFMKLYHDGLNTYVPFNNTSTHEDALPENIRMILSTFPGYALNTFLSDHYLPLTDTIRKPETRPDYFLHAVVYNPDCCAYDSRELYNYIMKSAQNYIINYVRIYSDFLNEQKSYHMDCLGKDDDFSYTDYVISLPRFLEKLFEFTVSMIDPAYAMSARL